MTKTYEDKRNEDLMEWIAEYGIETEIIEHMAEYGHIETESWLRSWFDGVGEAAAIVSMFAE